MKYLLSVIDAKLFASIALLSVSTYAHAAGISGSGNGGDICEARFKEITDDISAWLAKGGAAGLNLPAGVSLENYVQSMQNAIKSAKVSCTDDTLKIGRAEKACINFVTNEGENKIKCNVTRLQFTSQSDQYVLVHHEYAGIAGLELNKGESSDYSVSNQITGFLEEQVVKKLVVRPHGSSDKTRLLACSSPYTGSFEAKSENGWVSFNLAADGFLTKLPLADKLQIQSPEPITKARFMIPSGRCAANRATGALTCSGEGVFIEFSTASGSIVPLKTYRVDISAGVLGLGLSSRQLIEVKVATDKPDVVDSQIYNSLDGGHTLCGRRLD